MQYERIKIGVKTSRVSKLNHPRIHHSFLQVLSHTLSCTSTIPPFPRKYAEGRMGQDRQSRQKERKKRKRVSEIASSRPFQSNKIEGVPNAYITLLPPLSSYCPHPLYDCTNSSAFLNKLVLLFPNKDVFRNP